MRNGRGSAPACGAIGALSSGGNRRRGAGFLGGGFVGALASLFVNGGLSSITSMFGGRTTSVNGAMGV